MKIYNNILYVTNDFGKCSLSLETSETNIQYRKVAEMKSGRMQLRQNGCSYSSATEQEYKGAVGGVYRIRVQK